MLALQNFHDTLAFSRLITVWIRNQSKARLEKKFKDLKKLALQFFFLNTNFIFSWLFLMRRIKRVWKFEFYQNIQLVNDKDLHTERRQDVLRTRRTFQNQ